MITAVTTCMGRREHLEITLPLMLEEFDGNVVVVDWSCPQESGLWAARQGALVVKRFDQKYWDASKARNFGARAVESRSICFIDADTVVTPGLKKEIEDSLNLSTMILAARNSKGHDIPSLFGFIAVDIGHFWGVKGYNESLQGYGAEDEYLRVQLRLERGLKTVRTSSLSFIRHTNELRARHEKEPLHVSSQRNRSLLMNYLSTHGIDDYNSNPLTADIAPFGTSHERIERPDTSAAQF